MRIYVVLILLCLVFSQAWSQQTEINVFVYPANIELIDLFDADTLLNPLNTIESTIYNYQAFISLTDTLDVESFSLVLKEDTTVVVSGLFQYDLTPSTGFTYERIENSVFIGLGEFDLFETYTLEVTIEDLSGSNTTYVYNSSEE